jgi:GntR family transcriptional repressor for pyruvate dehydrogenase complex
MVFFICQEKFIKKLRLFQNQTGFGTGSVYKKPENSRYRSLEPLWVTRALFFRYFNDTVRLMKTKKETNWDIRTSTIQYQTLYEQVADSLEKLILDEGADCKRLPTEHDLVIQYGVSRSVIREALKVLKERGLVSMRAGDGSYVTIPNSSTISQTLSRVMRFNGISDDKITEVRSILESSAVGDAAVYATDDDIKHLENIVDQMEKCKNNIAERAQKDCEFHYAIARLSHNELLALMVESLMELIRKYIEKRLQTYPEGNEGGIIAHRKIIKAIKSHNSGQAEKYMRHHIKESFHQIDRK